MFVRTALSLVFLVSFGAAQSADSVRESMLEELKRSGAKAEVIARVDSMARRVVASADAAELKRLAARPLAERVRAVMRRWRALRDAEVRRFTEENPEARRMARPERVRRTFSRKIDTSLEQAIERSIALGVLSDEEADEMRALKGRAKVEALRELTRDAFLSAWGDSFAEGETKRLRGLDPRAFWRDETVRGLRLSSAIRPAERRALARLSADDRRELLDALASGGSLDVFVGRGLITADLAARVTALPPPRRVRLARELERIHFHKGKRIAIPRHILQQLDEEDRRTLRRMSTPERLRWLRARRPDRDWNAYHRRFRARRSIEKALNGLPPGARRMIRHRLGRKDRKKLEKLDPAGQIDLLKQMFPDVGWPR